ncbi:UpxY family transcription antiterminator [Fulvivirga sp. 29W222]|uniref:UpxY family transcription antiterminator n=1 Tax=Fulvivirga marina TaxID=2494733 RepID=A0A937G209_9BACT|nr:UpxY family transcription antiterminator [Fulvivirga marina]MBL6449172.1 UpxY family transcription antiterminator [Fulvivirga marina]
METPSVKPSCWQVVYTYSQYEKKVQKEFQRKGIESFLPLQKKIRQWSDRKRKVEVPLFPNYIFVRVAIKNLWKVLKVNGIVKFISSEGRPVTVSNATVDSIRKLINHDVEVTNELFTEGDIVRVIRGPLSETEGVLVEKKGKSRLAIQISIMKQSVLVDIAPCDLEKVGRLEQAV